VRKRHIVMLSEPERAQLHTLIGQGAAPARALTHARILLKANQGEAGPGWTDRVIAEAFEVHPDWSRRGLAVHHRGCPHQAQAPLPCNSGLTAH
jgi:hypothetical protein